MASLLKDIMDYFGGLSALLTQSDTCSDGTTDDKKPEEPGKEKNFKSSKTDARNIAASAFPKGKPVSAAVLFAAQSAYETTQAQSRLVTAHGFSREDMYRQSKEATEARQNHIKMKQDMLSTLLQTSEQVSKLLKIK